MAKVSFISFSPDQKRYFWKAKNKRENSQTENLYNLARPTTRLTFTAKCNVLSKCHKTYPVQKHESIDSRILTSIPFYLTFVRATMFLCVCFYRFLRYQWKRKQNKCHIHTWMYITLTLISINVWNLELNCHFHCLWLCSTDLSILCEVRVGFQAKRFKIYMQFQEETFTS